MISIGRCRITGKAFEEIWKGNTAMISENFESLREELLHCLDTIQDIQNGNDRLLALLQEVKEDLMALRRMRRLEA